MENHRDAGQESSTTAVVERQVRARLGEEAPFRQQGQTAQAGQGQEVAGDLPGRLRQYRQKLHDDFPFFLKEVWRLYQNLTPSRIQYDFARWIAYGPDRCGALGFRGMAKTWITNAACAWWLYRDREEKILLVCANEAYAKDSLVQIRGWLDTIPFLQHLRPDKGRRDNTEAMDVAGSRIDRIASLRALGITGALPGGRASKIIVDDGEQPENTTTRQQRDTLARRISEVEPILVPWSRGMTTRPAIRVLGTYQHLESIYDKLQRTAPDRDYVPYRFRNWPIQYPQVDELTSILSPLLAKDLKEGRAKPGDPVWPERFSRGYMRSLNMGRSRFLQQYMGFQDTSNTLRFPLRLSDLIVHPVNTLLAPVAIQWGKMTSRGSTAIEEIPSTGFGDDQFYGPCMVSDQWVPYVGCIGFVDPAGSGEDEFTWCIGGQLHGYIHTKALCAVKGGPTEQNINKLVLSFREQHCHEMHVEDTFGGDALIRLIEMTVAIHTLPRDEKNAEYPNGWSCAVIAHHSQHRGAKETWICDQLEPVMNHHRLVVSPEIAKDSVLMSQLVLMTRERDCQEHDDRVEALAGMVSKFADALGQNPQRQAEQLAERRRAEALEAYYQAHGLPTPPKTWSGLQIHAN